MDLELSDDQEFFRATTRRFLEAESPLTAVRQLEHDPVGYPRSYWKQGAELGWTSMLVPDGDGGGSLSGDGLRDLAIVVEEMGRLVAPGPLIPTSVVSAAIVEDGTDEQRASILPGIVAGDLVAAWAFAEEGAVWDPTKLSCSAVPAEGGGGYVITGVKTPVEAAAQADVLLVTAMTDEGMSQFLVDPKSAGVTVTPLSGLDLVRRLAEVHLDGVEVPASSLLGPAGGARTLVDHLVDVAAVLQCAELCGAADRVLEFTLEYVDDRYSFGRPLSSYQALKHRFADMKMWLEASHGTTTAAVGAVQRRSADAAELASAAKSYVGSHATEIIQDCIQMHGGIGVTWEHDLHLYLRRATVGRGMYGSPAEHRERVAVIIGMGEQSA